jgi:hypothetical protein
MRTYVGIQRTVRDRRRISAGRSPQACQTSPFHIHHLIQESSRNPYSAAVMQGQNRVQRLHADIAGQGDW